jgi:hypothetical protein
MVQIFHPATNTFSKATIFGGIFMLAAIVWIVGIIYRSPYVTNAQVMVEQPVPFSHKHHVGGLGIDCRYCHTTVETNSFAGMPATEICMNCHSQIWVDSPMLEPVRESLKTGRPLRWNRVHNLADFVFFDHSIHVAKGIGCTSCHGQVDQMPLMLQEKSLLMEWCLECHREPERFIRPKEEVFSVSWQPPADQKEQGRRLAERYHVRKTTDCTTCHR